MNLSIKQANSILERAMRVPRALSDPVQRAWAQAWLAASIRGAVDPSVVVLGAPSIAGTGRIRLGREVRLGRDLHLETHGQGQITLGSRVVLSRGVRIVSCLEVHVGEGTTIGEHCRLCDADLTFGQDAPRSGANGSDAAPILIGHDAWIGRGSTILPGVVIGNGAVVGANSVVTRNVPAGAVVAGAPATAFEHLAEVA